MDSETNAAWVANSVFDGARAFSRLAPDLDLHCQRAVRSARTLEMKPPVTAEEIEAIAREGIRRFPRMPSFMSGQCSGSRTGS